MIYGPAQGLSSFLADAEVRSTCTRAFNDFGVEFNAADPDRLVLLAVLPGHTPEAAAEDGAGAEVGEGGVDVTHEDLGGVATTDWYIRVAVTGEVEVPDRARPAVDPIRNAER